ncbi:MAG: hypothetical protein ACRD3Q_01925 [Terriglobales bacterium]
MSDNAMRSHKEAMEFDATMEIIGQVMACYTTKIHREKSKEKPNYTLIEHWDEERKRCAERQDGLIKEGPKVWEKVRVSYGAKVRAMMQEIKSYGK